jgi:diguanylate cyclase (GGDEF)-like protein/PAS domain S-box-containing protein
VVDGEERAAHLAAWEQQNDLVVGLDPDGVVTYVNEVVARTLGFARDEIVGQHIASFVHPDDLLRAAEVMAEMQKDDVGVGVTPAIYRVRRSDDSWLPLEINGSPPITTGPLAGWMLLIARYSGDHDLQRQIAELLTRGAPIGEVIALIPEFGHWRHPDEPYLVMYTGLDGKLTAVGADRTVELCNEHRGDDTPWARAMATRETVSCGREELSPALAAAARDLGLQECLAVPVPDPLQAGTAVIVAWSSDDGPSLAIHRYPIEQMTGALSLVMQWRQHIAALERSARYDALTGLSNRSSFFELLDRRRFADGGPLVGLLYIDLDGFKVVNDEHGHAAGDAVLREVASRMREAIFDGVRDGDVVARLGGDEFAVLCNGLARPDDAVTVAERLLHELERPIDVGARTVRVGASIWIAVGAPDELATDELLEQADEAMYAAKAAGKNSGRVATGANVQS